MAPNPDAYRDLEAEMDRYFEFRGWRTLRTGQEYCSALGRWSPDRWVSAGFWADAKIRNREYPHFLIEWAEIERHIADFTTTLYFLVARDPLEIAGWISAPEARRWCVGSPRTDHRGNGSSDPYVLIPAKRLHGLVELDVWLGQPIQSVIWYLGASA